MALRACSTLTLQDVMQAVDLEVIKMRTQVPSETTRTREDFHTKLLERDVFCVWTGLDKSFGSGLHIIPFGRGSEVCVHRLCAPGYIFPLAISVASAYRRESSALQRECGEPQ